MAIASPGDSSLLERKEAAMFPPIPPPCPLCDRPNAELVRQTEGFPAGKETTKTTPTVYVFTFSCPCGCSFAVTVDKRHPAQPVAEKYRYIQHPWQPRSA
jgi:hypothetical protein